MQIDDPCKLIDNDILMDSLSTPTTLEIQCPECYMSVVCIPAKASPPEMEKFLYEGTCSNSISNCSMASKTFFCCKLCIGDSGHCGKSTGYIRQWKYVRRHYSTSFHQTRLSSTRCSALKDYVQEEQDHFVPDVDSGDSVFIEETTVAVPEVIPSLQELRGLGFDKDSMTPRFMIEELRCKGQGIRWLTANAFGLQSSQVSDEEARFCLRLSSLLVQLSEHQKKQLGEILTIAGNNGHPQLSIFQNIRLPTTSEDFDRFFLTGKNAILPNLPHPVPKNTPDGTHSFVSLTDLLANEFGKATEFDQFEFYTTIQLGPHDRVPSVSSTMCANSLYITLKECHKETDEAQHEAQGESFVIYLWLREWRDDFDPNNTKSSRNQVWCNTFTLSPPQQSTNIRGATTYYMGLSSKGDDHRQIEEIMANELDLLSSVGMQVYHGGLRKVIRIKVGKLLISIDRPERTSMFNIGDHNGTYSTCWGFASSVDGNCMVNHLPACTKCKKERSDRLLNDSTTSTTASSTCNSCSNWNLEDPKFVFLAPPEYPQRYDQSTDAPQPPILRNLWYRIEDIQTATTNEGEETNQEENGEGTSKKRKKQRRKKPTKRIYLRTVRLSVTWLKEAVTFACHNVRQPFEIQRPSKKFWTKSNFVAFLKTCALTNRMIESLYQECSSRVIDPTLPVCWNDATSLAKCHFAPMHMLFLGHVKSNIEMMSKWLGKYNKLATFGKQANKYLNGIRSLRATKFFCAQPLSTSSWGTGVWVSENYLLGARLWRFIIAIPSICNDRLFHSPTYKEEWNTVSKFMTSMTMCLGRIMTNQKTIPDMEDYIHLYMDYMVEVDRILASVDRQKKNPNFVKSNSLGILSCAKAHEEMGPALLHWEGGWEGERKIQQVKPMLTIKRSTANWTMITMRKLYQYDTLEWMLDKMDEQNGSRSRRKRDSDAVLKVFKNRQEMEQDLASNAILCGLLGNDKHIYLAYRPTGEEEGNTRRLVKICRVMVDDTSGEWTPSRCWTAPLHLGTETKLYDSIGCLWEDFIEEVLICMPRISETNGSFTNLYYIVGNLWRERQPNGLHTIPDIRAITSNE